jgi:amylosucrase
MLTLSQQKRFQLPEGTAWLNYVRSHDDIGWGFANEDAHELGIDPDGHRHFLNEFFSGRFPGSFARGLPFQENPLTGDCRISGTTASLAGVETEPELGIKRMLMIHAVIMLVGGIPLIYWGDEVGQLNDLDYGRDPEHGHDNRWAHRPVYPSDRLAEAKRDPASVPGRIYNGLKALITIRRSDACFEGSTVFVETGSPHVFAFERRKDERAFLCLFNFSEHQVEVMGEVLEAYDYRLIRS